MSRLVERREVPTRNQTRRSPTGGEVSLWIVERPSGSMSPADLDRMLGSMKANGMVPDMVVVDYADLMRASYDLRDDRANIRSIYTDLRALYDKHNVAGITASQTNGAGGASEVATMMHVMDTILVVRIADHVSTINKTEEEEAKGEARLYFAGSRNQKGGVSVQFKWSFDKVRFIERIMDVL
ncbi:hypothetical protein QM042_02680 [Escherichia coli]|uniref:hypothetical protein n=1 Tax=Escherichia coli TaxID=562 RepID=UPI0039867ACF